MLILRAGTHTLCDNATWRAQKMSVEHMESGREALEFLKLYDYDLILIDWGLSDMPATRLLSTVRAVRMGVPAIVVGDETSPPNAAVIALDAGADDYFDVSTHPLEVLARVRAVVRRNFGHAASVLSVGDVELNLDQREVRVRGQRLTIARREFDLLELLFLKPGAILNKNSFLNHLWVGGEEPESKAVDVLVCRVRRKFDAADVPNIIKTVWGCGYILGDGMVVTDDALLRARKEAV